MRYFLIALFGLLGIFSRYFAGALIGKYLVHPFPVATFAINIAGAFFAGVFYVFAFERSAVSADLAIAILVGFFGGFTTFSAYCLEAFRLFEAKDYAIAATYFVASPLLGLLAAFGATLLTRRFT